MFYILTILIHNSYCWLSQIFIHLNILQKYPNIGQHVELKTKNFQLFFLLIYSFPSPITLYVLHLANFSYISLFLFLFYFVYSIKFFKSSFLENVKKCWEILIRLTIFQKLFRVFSIRILRRFLSIFM